MADAPKKKVGKWSAPLCRLKKCMYTSTASLLIGLFILLCARFALTSTWWAFNIAPLGPDTPFRRPIFIVLYSYVVAVLFISVLVTARVCLFSLEENRFVPFSGRKSALHPSGGAACWTVCATGCTPIFFARGRLRRQHPGGMSDTQLVVRRVYIHTGATGFRTWSCFHTRVVPGYPVSYPGITRVPNTRVVPGYSNFIYSINTKHTLDILVFSTFALVVYTTLTRQGRRALRRQTKRVFL